MSDLSRLVAALRANPGLRAKRDLADVAAIIGGDGDDTALHEIAGTGTSVAMGAEAILPGLVRADPYVAGIAGVVTALNDLAATGARPVGVLDTIVGSRELVREVLRGLRAAADRYRAPLLGGHTTIDDEQVGLSTFAVGTATRPLRAANARAGDEVVMVTCLDGQMVAGPGGAGFFSHLRGSRASSPADDLALIAELAESGDAHAGRDISMPGVVGSLLQFLESAGGLGATLDLDRIPTPAGIAPIDWLTAFPSYGFLLCGDADRIVAAAASRSLAAAPVACLDGTGVLRATADGETAVVWDLGDEPFTGLGAATRSS